MPFAEAGHHFSLLSIGDGLCAQIPALLISVATGILVTRSAGSEKDLGIDGLHADPRPAQGAARRRRRWSWRSASSRACRRFRSSSSAALFFAVGWTLRNKPTTRRARASVDAGRGRRGAEQAQLPAPRDAALDALALDPLELAIGFGLVPLVDQQRRRHAARRASARSAARSPPSSAWSSRRSASATTSAWTRTSTSCACVAPKLRAAA